jgi:hypothetical protein
MKTFGVCDYCQKQDIMANKHPFRVTLRTCGIVNFYPAPTENLQQISLWGCCKRDIREVLTGQHQQTHAYAPMVGRYPLEAFCEVVLIEEIPPIATRLTCQESEKIL